MDDTAIFVITRFIEECLFEPGINWPENEFKRRSYSRGAAFEVLEQIMDNPLESPALVIEKFLIKLTFYLYMTDDANKNLIFSVAVETIEEILGMFLHPGEV